MKSLTYYIHTRTKILADFQISISVPLMNTVYFMILNHVKLERAVVPSIFPLKTLISNKMVISTSNSLKVLGLVENELKNIFSKSI